MYARRLDFVQLLNLNSFFLFGARGVGKTSWIQNALPDAKRYDLLDGDTYQRLARRPRVLGEEIGDAETIVIDEVQKLPPLLDEVHRLLVEHPRLRFLLTGSSARKLKRGHANMLAGRAWETRMYPLTSTEIDDFDLLRYLNRGGLPRAYLSPSPREELAAYAGLYLREEIAAEAAVRHLDAFARFLDVMALNNGCELNYQMLSSDAGVPARTLTNYIQVLEDTLIAQTLPAYRKTTTRKAISRAKFYFFDVGVAGQLARRGSVEEKSELFGQTFEHFMFMELRSYLSYRRLEQRLCYWRSTSQMEVDFIVGNDLAIEVKASEQVSERDLKGLRALREEGLIARFALVSLDPTKRVLDGVTVWPWREFLAALWSHTLLQAST